MELKTFVRMLHGKKVVALQLVKNDMTFDLERRDLDNVPGLSRMRSRGKAIATFLGVAFEEVTR